MTAVSYISCAFERKSLKIGRTQTGPNIAFLASNAVERSRREIRETPYCSVVSVDRRRSCARGASPAPLRFAWSSQSPETRRAPRLAPLGEISRLGPVSLEVPPSALSEETEITITATTIRSLRRSLPTLRSTIWSRLGRF